MNPIKFRVWKEGTTKGLEMYSWREVQESYMNEFFSNPKCNIMLFTGLHDRNGNEIYVGDLVYYGEEDVLYEVMINDFSQIPVIDCDLGQEKLYKCHKQVRVVGNIYEGFTA